MKLEIAAPAITSHHYYALPLAIICSEPRLKRWLYSEFVQWHTYRDHEDERTRLSLYMDRNERYVYGPLHETVARPKQLAGSKDVVSVFKGFLDDGQYIYDFVDHYYIRSLKWDRHAMHDILVYGYDDGQQAFHVYAYQGTKLAEVEVPYAEYEVAYGSDYQRAQHHLTVLYRKRETDLYPDIRRIGNHILDYLEGINTYDRESPLLVDLYRRMFAWDYGFDPEDVALLDLSGHFNRRLFTNSLDNPNHARINGWLREYVMNRTVPEEHFLEYKGIRFPVRIFDMDSEYDCLLCGRQEVGVPEGKYTALLLVATAQFGDRQAYITAAYGDGTREECALHVGDWCSSIVRDGHAIHHAAACRELGWKSSMVKCDAHLYLQRVCLDSEKRLEKLIFPMEDNEIFVFAGALCPASARDDS